MTARKCKGLTKLLYGHWRLCDNNAERGRDYCRAHRYVAPCPACRGTGKTRSNQRHPRWTPQIVDRHFAPLRRAP